MANDRLRQAANVLFSVTQVAAPALSPVLGLPFVGSVSDQYPTYVVPAGYAFSIWSVIFLLCFAYAAWQALPAQRENPLLRRVGWLTAAAFLGNTLWQIVFPLGWFWVSVAVIFGILASLVGVIARTAPRGRLGAGERWLVWRGFGLFLGWITVAAVANLAQTLLAGGWRGAPLDGEAWGMVMIAAAGLIGAAVTLATRNAGYPVSVVWALLAVFVARRAADGAQSTSVAWTAVAAALLVALALGFVLLRGEAGAAHRPAPGRA